MTTRAGLRCCCAATALWGALVVPPATAGDIDARVPTSRSRPPVYVAYGPREAEAPGVPPARPPIGSFGQAVTGAYETYPELLSLRASVRSADNGYPLARSAFGPKLSLEARHSFQYDRSEIAEDVFIKARGYSSTGVLVLSQPLLTFGRNHANEANALAQVAFARDSLRLRESEILRAVVAVYVSVIRDVELVAIAQENLKLLERQLADNTVRFDKRDITIADLEQVATRVEFGRAQLLGAQGQLTASRTLFLRYTGAPPGAALAPPKDLTVPVSGVDQALVLAEAAGPTIRAAQSREKISRALLAAAKADVRPRLDFEASGSHGSVSPYDNRLVGTDVRASLVARMQLWDSGERSARIREAAEANQSDWRLIDQAVRETREQVVASWDQWQAARRSVSHYQDAVRAAERAYDGAAIQERAGFRTTLDVLDLARDLLLARTNYVQTAATEQVAKANLLAAMGELEGPRLVPTLPAYDPADNFRKVARRGDVPLLTGVLSGIDGLANGDLSTDRPLRDPAARITIEPIFPDDPLAP